MTSEYLNDLRAFEQFNQNSPKAKEKKPSEHNEQIKGFPLEDLKTEKEHAKVDQK